MSRGRKFGPFTPHRMRLRRADGAVYLDRWGITIEALGGIYLHRMTAPDPGWDLHDHPWAFVTIPLIGGYTEQRCTIREAPLIARIADSIDTSPHVHHDRPCGRGHVEHRAWLRPHALRLDECHRITELDRPAVWTLVLRGPRRRRWGFYLPDGWVDEHAYDATVRAARRDLWNEVG